MGSVGSVLAQGAGSPGFDSWCLQSQHCVGGGRRIKSSRRPPLHRDFESTKFTVLVLGSKTSKCVQCLREYSRVWTSSESFPRVVCTSVIPHFFPLRSFSRWFLWFPLYNTRKLASVAKEAGFVFPFAHTLSHAPCQCLVTSSPNYFLCIDTYTVSPKLFPMYWTHEHYFLCIKWASSSLCRCHAGLQLAGTWISSRSQVLHTCHLSPEHSVSSHSWLWVSPIPQAPGWNACPPITFSCLTVHKETFSLILTLFLR